MIVWPPNPREKLKIKYLFFCKAFSYQTWQGGDLWWGKLIHNARWPSDHVILWGQVTNWKLSMSSSTRSMTTKHGRLVTYDVWNAPMESHDSLTLSWCVVTWQIKSAMYSLRQGLGHKTWQVGGLWPPNFQGADVWWGKTHTKVAWLSSRDHKMSRVNGILNISSSTKSVPPDLAGWWRMVTGSLPWSNVTLWLWILVRLEKYKT